MLQPFIWMFKTENFKLNFCRLFLCSTISLISALVFSYIKIPAQYVFYSKILSVLLYALPILYILGYFWNLVFEIIMREVDVSANSIYNGKIKTIYKINLPESKICQTIWRGFSSIVGVALLFLPVIYIINQSQTSTSFNMFAYGALAVSGFILFFIPGLLWNHAYKNSIFAGWNLRKAIYIMGNYPARYIGCTLYFLLIFGTNIFIYNLISSISSNVGIYIIAAIAFLAEIIYSLFVLAYALGTIVPTSEV